MNSKHDQGVKVDSLVVPDEGIEPPTFGLQNRSKWQEICPHKPCAYPKCLVNAGIFTVCDLRASREKPPSADDARRHETRHSGEME